MVVRLAAGFGVSDIIKGEHNAVDGQILFLRQFLHLLNADLDPFQGQRRRGLEITAQEKAQGFEQCQPVGFQRMLFEAFQYIEGPELQSALLTRRGIQQADGTRGQVAGILIRLAVSVPNGLLQSGKIAGADKRLSGDHKALFVRDL